MSTSISNQAAPMQSGVLTVVPSHGARALLDPPPNPAFRLVVRALPVQRTMVIAPATVNGKTRPEGPSVAEAIAHLISHRTRLPCGGLTRMGRASLPLVQFLPVFGLAGVDERSQVVPIGQGRCWRNPDCRQGMVVPNTDQRRHMRSQFLGMLPHVCVPNLMCAPRCITHRREVVGIVRSKDSRTSASTRSGQ